MKQIIILRKDLNMRKGKMVAQGAHASLSVVLNNLEHPNVKEWLSQAFTKVCLYVNSEEELQEVYKNAKDAGLLAELIVDNGLTEFHGVKTPTAVAIGPEPPEKLNPITGDLKLL
jgi:PTH2 family peptidyl-tRNA hydrolase